MSIYIHDHRRFKVAAIDKRGIEIKNKAYDHQSAIFNEGNQRSIYTLGLDIIHNHKPVVSLKGRVVFNLISAIINESSDYHLKCLITSCEDVLKQREDKLRRSGEEL